MTKSKNATNWLIWAAAITVLYLIGLGSLIGWQKLVDFLSSPDLNEIGDFLAGFFSPLAFIWLVAAVLTQRQELNETRNQFDENQKVTEAQLKTINEQFELAKRQNEIAEGTAKKNYKLALFEERYKLYQEFVDFGKHYHPEYGEDAYEAFVEFSLRAEFIFDNIVCHWFDEIGQAIYELNELTQIKTKIDIDEHGNPIGELAFEPQGSVADIENVTNWLWEQFYLTNERNERFRDQLDVNE